MYTFAKILAGGIISLGLYLYDDLLWGPIPLAFFGKLFGWPAGALVLSLLYFIISFAVSYRALTYFRTAQGKKSKYAKHTERAVNGRRKAAYKLLLKGRWVGLAISCFTLGGIISSIVIGKYNLYSDKGTVFLASTTSLLFVVLFVGFYAGLFSSILSLFEL